MQRAAAEGSCRGQMQRADAEGRCRGQMQRADAEGSCRGQIQADAQADAQEGRQAGRCTFAALNIVNTHIHPYRQMLFLLQ